MWHGYTILVPGTGDSGGIYLRREFYKQDDVN